MKKFVIIFALTLFAILASVDAVFKGANVQDRRLVPWYAQVETNKTNGDQLLCGGSIVRLAVVLTSASCLGDKVVANTATYSGYLNYKMGRKTARALIAHESYSPSTNMCNIGFIILSSPYTASNSIGVITLPTPGQPYDGVKAAMYGHGQVGNSDFSNVIRKGVGTILWNVNCNITSYGSQIARIYDICTDRYVTSTDGIGCMCDGDEGGPLMVEGTNIQIGIYKFLSGGVLTAGKDCEVPVANAPIPVFERLAIHVTWIYRTLRMNGLL